MSSSKINTAAAFLTLVILLISFAGAHAQGWYSGEWPYRKTISIDYTQVADDLTYFPVLVDFIDADLQSKAQPDGEDILFTSDDGMSKLNHEIEYFDSSSGHLVAWVNVPSLSSNQNTIIEMYYGNAGASDQENPAGVWDSNYKAVHHFAEVSGDYLDSTSYGNDGTTTVAVTTRTGAGKIGFAPELDGIDDYVEIPYDTSLNFHGSTITIEVWINTDDATKGQAVVSKNLGSGAGTGWNTEAGFQAHDISFQSGEGSPNYLHTATDQLQDNSWLHGVYVYPGSGTGTIYVNGVAQATTGAMGSWTPQSTFLRIGMANPSTDRYPFDGKLDEVRLSNIARSSAWIQTSYNNMNEPSHFSTRGPEETTGSPVIFNPNPAHGASAVLITLEDLDFELGDLQGDAIDYSVTTSPDIGSKNESGVSNGIYALPISGLAYGTTYTWYVSATDPDGSGEWSNAVFEFTTEFDAPDISGENPADGSAEVSFNPTLSADIHDTQGESVEWEIWTDTSGSWQMIDSGTLPGGVGTVSTSAFNMDQYSTSYYWRVHARDSGSGEWVIETYSFRTLENKMNFAAFADPHVGSRCDTGWAQADYLDLLGQDVVNQTVPCEFVVNLGDIVHTTTAQITGVGLPGNCDQYKNNLKAYHIQHLNLPFHIIAGNHDEGDYRTNSNDPYKLTRGLINETETNTYPYAMMRNGILFLTIPEMSYIQWTSQYIKEWVEYMVQQYPNSTTMILAHQAIEDTTRHQNDNSAYPYRGKQDTDWWAELFRNNEQIKMWIHGHQHWTDWYQGSQSSGRSHPVYDFGHEMVFSAPYSQVDFGTLHEEDRIVIYTISSTGISTRAWENNGAGGHWVTGYDHEWQISTTYDENAQDWYSYAIFIQDGETQLTDMKVLSSDIRLELIGTKPMELFFDEQMSTTSGWAGEVILSFANDQSGVTANTPGMTVAGPKTLTFPPKNYRGATWEDGKSGQPYNFFPMGVTPHAVPGATYNFTITAKANSGTGTIHLDASVSDWGTGSQYSTLAGSSATVISHEFGTSFETISGTYTVPADQDAWFLQGSLDFEDSTDYDVTLFSIKRVRETDTTDDFEMVISGTSYNVTGTLHEDEKVEFSVDPVDLAQSDGVINFTGSIGGNRYGMARLIYHGPILMGRNARFRVNSASGGLFDVTLTDKVSGWPGSVFKMFPFSITDNDLSITASDGSNQQHVSSNGNVWVSSNTPDTGEIDLVITYEALAPAISEESPEDGVTDVALNPALTARIRELQEEQVDWEIKTNASGTWETVASGTLPSGEGTISATPATMNDYDTTYNWSVSAIDIGGTGEWVTRNYSFTTRLENYQPVINDPNPENGALNVSPNPTLSVDVSDEDGDLMEITFETDATGSWQVIQAYTGAGNGSYNAGSPAMNEYSTTYHWRVTADDGNGTVTTETNTFTTEAEPGVWWNSSWIYRKAITIDHTKVDEDLVDFPVLIEFTDSEVAAHAQTDADDLVFTDYYGVPLSHEIEEYESSPGHLVAWAEVPFLSSTEDTTLYLYYGNSGAANQEDVEGTWDGSNHVMVQHLEEITGTHYDATNYHNDSNAVVVNDQDATGSIDGADEFDGIADYVKVPDNSSLQFDEGGFTAEAWIYPNSVPDTGGGGARIVNNRGTATGGNYKGYQLKIKNLSGNWHFGDASIDDATGNYKAYDGTNTYSYNQWYQVAMVYEADSELRFYVNGVLDGTLAVGAYGDITNSLPTAIGASLADQGVEGADDRQYFDGIIDEVRLSEIARSGGWISTEYHNQSAPDTFFILGGEETQGVECTGHGDCGFCEKCEGGSCILQSGEDLREDCPDEPCTTGLCDGAGACGIEPDTTVCRMATGGCDVDETCDGISAACAADTFEPEGTLCRDIQGDCDFAEYCSGGSATCPADAKSTGLCRASAGECDLAESCDGTTNTCPADAKSTGLCKASAGECDLAESCDGTTNTCPADAKSTGLCRASAGECDLAESCDGTTNTCPADQLKPAATLCRASAGECDFAESCTGNAAECPEDAFQPNSTPCDDGLYCTQIEECQDGQCLGSDDPCPDNEDYCDGVEYCEEDGDGYLCSLTGDPCDPPLTCDELDDTCLDSDVTLIIANAYGFSGTIGIELINELDFVSEVHLDVCNVDQHAWLHISTDSCSTTARTGGFICTISAQLNGCVRVDLTSPGDLINPGGTGAIANLSYTLGAIAPVEEYADLKPENIAVEDDAATLLTVTPKPGKVGAVEMDSDGDGIPDHLDNCPDDNNPDQEDTYPPDGNGIGDACDCEADFNCDANVDAADVTKFLEDFGRSLYTNPCSNADPCNGDFNCDGNVDAADVTKFLEDFGRSPFFNPCPAVIGVCEMENWCSYE